MEFSFEYASSVSNYQEFIVFLEKLQLDYTHNLQEWENPNLEMVFRFYRKVGLKTKCA